MLFDQQLELNTTNIYIYIYCRHICQVTGLFNNVLSELDFLPWGTHSCQNWTFYQGVLIIVKTGLGIHYCVAGRELLCEFIILCLVKLPENSLNSIIIFFIVWDVFVVNDCMIPTHRHWPS
jgi:hypothetical protein